MISYLATLIVGLVFLVTGIVKALNSRKFTGHILEYRIFPSHFIQPIAILFIGVECALGTALVLHAFPEWLVPGTAILLVVLSAITFWSTSTGRTDDCGCYGGLAMITPTQSILLNLGYLSLLGLAFYFPVANLETATWKWILALVMLGFFSFLAQKSQHTPLIDLSYLKAGKQWKESWLENSHQNLQTGKHFIVFLGPECPYCKQWVPLLNIMNANPELPKVMGLMTLNESEISAFKEKHLVHFPIVTMDKILFRYMVDGVPTAALIKDSKIDNVSMGAMPQEYFKEIQQFYRATVKRNAAKNTIRFAG